MSHIGNPFLFGLLRWISDFHWIVSEPRRHHRYHFRCCDIDIKYFESINFKCKNIHHTVVSLIFIDSTLKLSHVSSKKKNKNKLNYYKKINTYLSPPKMLQYIKNTILFYPINTLKIVCIFHNWLCFVFLFVFCL